MDAQDGSRGVSVWRSAVGGPGRSEPALRHDGQTRWTGALSEVEKDVVAILQVDGRASVKSIAAALDVTTKVASRLVSNLLSTRDIRVTTVTDPLLLGYGAMAFAEFKLTGDLPARDVSESFAKLSCVDYVVRTTGPTDMLINLVCTDMAELADVIESHARHAQGANLIEVTPYTALHYQKISRGTSARRYQSQAGLTPDLNHSDRAIVRALSEDGRAPLLAIAEQIGVSESHVRSRLKKLISSGVVRVAAVLDAGLMGYGALAWGRACVVGGPIAPVIEALVEVDAVTYVAETAGSFDIMFELTCVDDAELREALDVIRQIPFLRELAMHRYLDAIYKPMIPSLQRPGSPVEQEQESRP